jgi:hypothetical protein
MPPSGASVTEAATRPASNVAPRPRQMHSRGSAFHMLSMLDHLDMCSISTCFAYASMSDAAVSFSHCPLKSATPSPSRGSSFLTSAVGCSVSCGCCAAVVALSDGAALELLWPHGNQDPRENRVPLDVCASFSGASGMLAAPCYFASRRFGKDMQCQHLPSCRSQGAPSGWQMEVGRQLLQQWSLHWVLIDRGLVHLRPDIAFVVPQNELQKVSNEQRNQQIL